jgi:hypothetical protein
VKINYHILALIIRLFYFLNRKTSPLCVVRYLPFYGAWGIFEGGNAMKTPMDLNFEFYNTNQDEIVTGHIGEFVVIDNASVAGYYKEEREAFHAMKEFELGTFMVKKCKPRGKDIITYFNNRVSFA